MRRVLDELSLGNRRKSAEQPKTMCTKDGLVFPILEIPLGLIPVGESVHRPCSLFLIPFSMLLTGSELASHSLSLQQVNHLGVFSGTRSLGHRLQARLPNITLRNLEIRISMERAARLAPPVAL